MSSLVAYKSLDQIASKISHSSVWQLPRLYPCANAVKTHKNIKLSKGIYSEYHGSLLILKFYFERLSQKVHKQSYGEG